MIDEEKLRAAREKLACHIQPPGNVAADAAVSGSDAAYSASTASNTASAATSDAAASGANTADAANAAKEQAGFIDKDGRVLLTQMTTAGG